MHMHPRKCTQPCKVLAFPKLICRRGACAGNAAYLDDVGNFYGQYQASEAAGSPGYVTDWNSMFQAANVLLAAITDDAWYHTAVQVGWSPCLACRVFVSFLHMAGLLIYTFCT